MMLKQGDTKIENVVALHASKSHKASKLAQPSAGTKPTQSGTPALSASSKPSMNDTKALVAAAGSKQGGSQISFSDYMITSSAPSSSASQAGTGTSVTTAAPKTPPRNSSSLPTMKGSSINRSFPKVNNGENSLLRSESRSKDSTGDTDQEVNRNSRQSAGSRKGSTETQDQQDGNRTPKNTSPRLSNHSENSEMFASPNASNYWPNNTGLFERIEQFKFSDKSKPVSDDEKMFVAVKLDMNSGQQSVDRKENESTTSYRSHSSKSNHSYQHDSSIIDHGYMPGHHIPDGTAYSQRSDYAHMDHKGECREDVAGMDDVGLAESRGFDVLKQGEKNAAIDRSSRIGNNRKFQGGNNVDKPVDNLNEGKTTLPMNLQPTQASRSPMVRGGHVTSMPGHVTSMPGHVTSTQTGSSPTDNNTGAGRRSTETQSIERHESWTQTSLVFRQSVGLQPDPPVNAESHVRNSAPTNSQQSREHCLESSDYRYSYPSNIKPSSSSSSVPEKPHLLTKQSLMQTEFAQDNLKRDYKREVLDRIYSGRREQESFMPAHVTQSDTLADIEGRDSIESHTHWQHLTGRETMDSTGRGSELLL